MADALTQAIAWPDVVTLADLRPLAGAAAPCITVVMPIPNPLELAARLKNAIRTIERQLAGQQVSPEIAGPLLAPVLQLAADAENAHVWANALVALRSPEMFRHFWIREALPEVTVAADRFEVRPLLAALAREQRFHVLALSRRHVRLIHATPHAAEERPIERVKLPEADFSAGSTSEKTGEKDRADDRRFLKDVEQRVTAILQPDSAPLILAGVEHETALYRRLNRYPHLLEETIHGSPEGLTARELHERGWEIVIRRRSQALDKALDEFRSHEGTPLVSHDAGVIARAAFEGRVAGLFLGPLAGAAGQPDDPVNLVAIETLGNGGWAFQLPAEEAPLPAPAAALLRF